MQIYRNGTLPITKAPEKNFRGEVSISGYFQRAAPSHLAGATVAFTPGSHTPWKVNPLGQTLIVLSGVGWAQCEGEEIVEIRAGDIIWCLPGRRHWDGATPDCAMTYVAIQEAKDGKSVEFGAKVSDEEYQKPPAASSLSDIRSASRGKALERLLESRGRHLPWRSWKSLSGAKRYIRGRLTFGSKTRRIQKGRYLRVEAARLAFVFARCGSEFHVSIRQSQVFTATVPRL